MSEEVKMNSIQRWINSYVESSRLTKVAAGFQQLCGIRQGKPHNLLLHYTFNVLTMLGSEEAYGALLPLLLWFCGGSIARDTMFCWMFLVAGGQFLTDIFRFHAHHVCHDIFLLHPPASIEQLRTNVWPSEQFIAR